ncbi:BTAD domain-containing putative transcriptional regulator [Streptomyces sp. NPDC047046]|uniref:AfsR/SARP family transcriptional regulator n=1 Tax=Streptomyces sp. NPDC047046 TaxID=3155378 RepID=UPI0033F13699
MNDGPGIPGRGAPDAGPATDAAPPAHTPHPTSPDTATPDADAPHTTAPQATAPDATAPHPASPETPTAPESPTATAPVRFALLGPIRAWRGTEQLPTGSPQQRALLAVLLLRAGRTATAPELIDAVWGEEPPAQALAALRTYASRLRKAFGGSVLRSEAGGYALHPDALGAQALDLSRAEELVAAADAAREEGDLCRARALSDEALALWEGEPLAQVPGPHAANQRARLAEWRLQVLESRFAMDLEQGCHAEAVSELTALTTAHPLRERPRELLMLALYRSGRQAEALAVYTDTRRLLAEELGVDPGPALARLQQRVLAGDEELARSPQPAPRGGPPPLKPAQLPASVADFTGRENLVKELSDTLAGAGSQVMAVSAVAGIGGVGKTTLAVHVAQGSRAAFPDGQLYANLQGAGAHPVDPETVLGGFLRALGVRDTALPASLDERAALYRSALDGRRVLILLDNAKDPAQIRPLLPGTEGCATLVTSRQRMVGLAGAHLVDLDVMSPEEALTLFTRIVGAERVHAEREAALDVVAACGFLPLAIRVAASRLAARRTWTVSVLAAKLADERRRLDELQAGDLAVAATFELGYGQLEADQARAFRLLGLVEGPDISLAAAAALLGLDRYAAEDLLESLVDTSFLESAAPGRYRYHDLVRLYARSCAERDEQPASARADALGRLLDFYLATTARVYALERPGDRLVDHLATTRYPGLELTAPEEAQDWLYAEAQSLLATARRATERADSLAAAVDLLWVAKDLSESGANARQYREVTRTAIERAEEHGARRALNRALLVLTDAEHAAGGLGQVRENAEGILARASGETARGEGTDDALVVAWAHNILGVGALYREEYEVGEHHLGSAVEHFRALGDQAGEAAALCNLSRIHLATGRLDSAIALAGRGTLLNDTSGNALRGANGRYALGLALTAAGRSAEAAERLHEALAVFRANRQRLWEGMTLCRLAEVRLAGAEAARAAVDAENALTVLGDVGGEWRRAQVLVVLGRALARTGQPGRAHVCWAEAERVYEEQGASAEATAVRALSATVPAP